MRTFIILLMVMAIAGTAIAQNVGSPNEQPIKNKPNVTYTPPADVKVGGDTIDSATVIPGIPYTDSGNTGLFMDNYDEVCPNTGSTSPDVVYSYTPGTDISIIVDLCGSGYDTKTYIYDDGLNLISCSDDYYYPVSDCGDWNARTEAVALSAGTTYYIVIDGYGGEFGPYQLSVTDFADCLVTCPPDAVLEGEPPLEHDGVDTYNTGCNVDPPVLQTIDWANTEAGEAWLCGRSGWFLFGVDNYRDTDWFTVTAAGTEMTFTVQADYPCLIIKVATPGCPAGVEYIEASSCGLASTLTFPTTPGEEVWLIVIPEGFTPLLLEFNYFATLIGHVWTGPVPNEEMSWGGVKALYR